MHSRCSIIAAFLVVGRDTAVHHMQSMPVLGPEWPANAVIYRLSPVRMTRTALALGHRWPAPPQYRLTRHHRLSSMLCGCLSCMGRLPTQLSGPRWQGGAGWLCQGRSVQCWFDRPCSCRSTTGQPTWWDPRPQEPPLQCRRLVSHTVTGSLLCLHSHQAPPMPHHHPQQGHPPSTCRQDMPGDHGGHPSQARST